MATQKTLLTEQEKQDIQLGRQDRMKLREMYHSGDPVMRKIIHQLVQEEAPKIGMTPNQFLDFILYSDD